jgi:hypothetical protein
MTSNERKNIDKQNSPSEVISACSFLVLLTATTSSDTKNSGFKRVRQRGPARVRKRRKKPKDDRVARRKIFERNTLVIQVEGGRREIRRAGLRVLDLRYARSGGVPNRYEN